jgi:signal transduction histidine kinase
MMIIADAEILIIDDTPSAIDYLASLLEADYRLSIATNGPDALQLLRGGYLPNLVLLDLMMPDMDGYEVYQNIRQIPACKDVPIIFLTAAHDSEAEKKGLALGAVDYINKPFVPEVVLHRIHNQIEREYLRRELQNQRDTLEEQVVQRTSALRVAKEAAESACKVRSMILANLSHELRTPIHAITSVSQLLRRFVNEEKPIDDLNKIDMVTKRLLTIVDNLLTLAELDQDRFSLSQEPFELGVLLLQCQKWAKSQTQAKNLKFKTELDHFPYYRLIGDYERLQLILQELLTNAIKFSKTGTITFKAECLEASAEKQTLRFEVQDEGIGISMSDRHKLFIPFQQLDGSMTREYGGNGIGLALCQELIDQMGGRMGMDDNEPNGCVFWFSVTLPVVATEGVE